MKNIFENSYDINYQLNLKQKTFNFINSSISKCMEISPEEIINIDLETFLGYMHPEDINTVKEEYLKILSE